MKKLAKKEFKKGDYISSEELEKVLGHKPDSLELMHLCKTAQDNHENITVKSEDGGIRFLTDNEATGYNHAWFLRHLRGLDYRNKRMSAVDQSNLTDDQKKKHGRSLEIQGNILAGIENTINELTPPEPYKSGIKRLL